MRETRPLLMPKPTHEKKTLYRTSSGKPVPQAVKQFGPVLVVVVLGLAVYLGSHWITSRHSASDTTHSLTDEPATDAQVRVTLTPEKMVTAGIQVCPVGRRELQATHIVPGTLQYDATRYLQLRAPVECVVMQVDVRTGQWVEAGDRLARLTSEQIGLARNQLKKCEADLRIAQLQHEWTARTQDNLAELLQFLKQDPTISELESRFDGKLLGEHRDHLISAYSQYLLAINQANRSRTLGEQGVVSGRTLEERTSRREITAAAFNAACEQSEFVSRHQLEVAAAERDVAERALAVSRERLRVLLGPHGQDAAESSGSELALTAPFAGRVEDVAAVEAARFDEGEPIVVLADTRRIWVAAQIHQRHWNSLKIAAGQTLIVTAPAIPDRHFEAQVRFVGSTVSPSTLALPLVAEMENTDSLFRPGMFVWVSVPVAEPCQALAVPKSAVQHHEGRDFVFVEDLPRTFRRVDISQGIETPEWVEITAGLDEGVPVVVQGTFQLKSELLLEHEEE